MNGTTAVPPQPTPRASKPPPAGPAPPAPAAAPPVPPSNAHPPQKPASTPTLNGNHAPHSAKGKKKSEPSPVDPAAMYESLKSRIAALEEEEVHEEEEEKKFAEEAQKSVKGMEDSAVHAKYIELFAELKRLERDHAKEKQKLTKDKDSAKSQLTKANQTKTKMENLARELQKDNKRLRDDSKRLAQCVEDAQSEIDQMKKDVAKRIDKAKQRDVKYREMPDIVVKIVCKYRADLFFKISRKTKLSRLFHAWTDRMESIAGVVAVASAKKSGDARGANGQINGTSKSDETTPTSAAARANAIHTMQFIFTHSGRTLEGDLTPEEAGIENEDELLAVELLDLTDDRAVPNAESSDPLKLRLQKNWFDDPADARRAMDEIFNGVVRERLKEVLRQYELRERHFECVIRSKELEVLLSRARAAEQKQLSDGEKLRADKFEEENHQLRKDLEDSQNGQTMLIDKLIHCCKEPNAERTQRLFASLREELEKRGIKASDSYVGS